MILYTTLYLIALTFKRERPALESFCVGIQTWGRMVVYCEGIFTAVALILAVLDFVEVK